ncbi:MAG TPA: ATP-binding protein [Candidatus Methylomirabilis sp.]|nr:ATP-binding protein [Candidatus Methylomirabilis sp.]
MSAEHAVPGEMILGQVEPEPARTSGRPHRAASPLSLEFVQELEAARRRVSVLEEANQAIHESLHRISRLSAFSEGLDRSASLGDVSDLLFEEVKGILPAKILMLALVEATGHEFRPHRVAPPEAAAAAAEEMRAQMAAGMFGWAVNLRRPTMISAVCLGANLILVPLATTRRTVGMLMIATMLSAESVQQQHLTLVAVLARQAAECIDNLRLAEEIRRQNEALQQTAETALARRVADLGLLVETARTVSGPLDTEAVLRHVAEVTSRHLGAPTVGVSLLQPDGRLPFTAGVGLAPECRQCAGVAVEDGGLAGWVATHCEPLMIPDVWADPRNRCCEVGRAGGLASYLGVPLVARDRVVGVLSVMGEAGREFTTGEVALLTGLAAQGALAIENARLFADVERRMEEQRRSMARLVHSARMASVGLLAGGVAHDINNPLCIISNHLQLLRLQAEALPQAVADALGPIETSVQRIATSVEAILEYARSNPGERQATDINEAIRRMRLLLHYHPLCRRLRLITDFGEEIPPVSLDRGAWDQVMLELLTNAHEAASECGAARISTRVLATGEPANPSPPPAWVEVVVADDGPGIPPEALPRVFDPFFTTKGPEKNLGLGLGICRDIVTEHGGRLRVESDGRSGTRVIIELPASPGGGIVEASCGG